MNPAAMPINRPEVHAELAAAFARYEEALVNNRIDVLDELFWASPHTVRYGAAECLRGIEAIRAFRAARAPQGLARTLHRTVITTFGSDFGTANTEFIRDIRESGTRDATTRDAPPRGGSRLGRQSQTWCRLDGRWVIVAAHVSLIDASLIDGPAPAPEPPT